MTAMKLSRQDCIRGGRAGDGVENTQEEVRTNIRCQHWMPTLDEQSVNKLTSLC